MQSDVIFKKATAIKQVKSKLLLFADMMINGYPTIIDRLLSFTTSILAMPKGSGSGIELGEKVT